MGQWEGPTNPKPNIIIRKTQ